MVLNSKSVREESSQRGRRPGNNGPHARSPVWYEEVCCQLVRPSGLREVAVLTIQTLFEFCFSGTPRDPDLT